jgi:hypothetical protein
MEVLMKYIIKTALALGLGVLMAFMACSDKSTSNNMTEGNYTNEDYTLAKQDVDSSMAEMNLDDQEAGDWLGWNPGAVLVDTVSYDSTTGWHLRAREFDGEHQTISLADSFRFTDLNSNYQLRHDSTTNVLERRFKNSYLFSAGPESLGTHWLKTRNRNANWVGLADSVTTLNGDFRRYWEGQTDYRDFDRTVTGEMSDIKFYTSDLENGRPTFPFSGTFAGTVVTNVTAPHRQAHFEGQLTLTFRMEDGRYCYHARLVRGDNWWEWDHCFPDSL